MSNLKPCPFCGTEPNHMTSELGDRPCFYYECENPKCGAAEKGWHNTEQEAIYAWNTRPIEDALRKENAALTLLHTQATDEMLKMQNRVHKLEAEIAQLKKDRLEFKAQCFHKDETISVLKNRITELEFDNRSLVEQMNAMALKPNQAVIEYFYPKHNPENRRIENLPTEECHCIVELYSGEYDIVWWIDGGFEETGWDGYCVDEVKSWAYLPKGVKHENAD